MDDFMRVLYEKERQLRAELEKIPAFVQLQVIQSTIKMFAEDMHSVSESRSTVTTIPAVYNRDDSWGKRILYVINKLGRPTVSEIVEEINLLDPAADYDNDWLSKRVSVMTHQLKSAGSIDVEMDGKRGKYYIK